MADNDKKAVKQKVEEFKKKKFRLSEQWNSYVVTTEAPVSLIIANILRQFDLVYSGSFKMLLGERGGISYKEGNKIINRSVKIATDFSDLTQYLSDLAGYRYHIPKGLECFRKIEKEAVKK